MNCAFGIQGEVFAILVADRSVVQPIVKMQDDDKKIIKIGEKQLLSSIAEVPVRKEFTKLIKSKLLYQFYKYGHSPLTSEAAYFTRFEVSDSLRSKNPMQVGSIIAGVDNDVPSLYIIEQLGGIEKVTKAVLGYCSHFLYGLMDSCYKKDFNLNEGKDCIRKCILELKTRFLVNIKDFDVYVITKNGIEDVSNEFNTK